MTKPDVIQTLVPLLIARLPDPFNPTKDDAVKCLVAARQWAEELQEEGGQDYQMFFVG